MPVTMKTSTKTPAAIGSDRSLAGASSSSTTSTSTVSGSEGLTTYGGATGTGAGFGQGHGRAGPYAPDFASGFVLATTLARMPAFESGRETLATFFCLAFGRG